MKFLSRVFGLDTTASRARQADRPSHQRRTQLRLETLEGRDLKSADGVSLSYGMLNITAPNASGGNVAVVNQVGSQVTVTVNDQTDTFNASDVWQINFTGCQAGHDTFVNNTGLNDVANGYGGGNQFYGGSGFNTISLSGDYSVYDARGGFSYVWAANGPNDYIPLYGNTYVTQYTWSGSWW
jgi:hypothetical protein